MRFKDLNGRLRFLNIEKYRIKWDEPSLSKFQYQVKQFLKPYWIGTVTYEECPMVGTRLKLDIYNATKRIAIEVNGGQHTKFNSFFHAGSRLNYLKQIRRDSKKYEWAQLNNITLIDIYPDDLPLTKSFFDKLNVSL
jgi:hypothetical protein